MYIHTFDNLLWSCYFFQIESLFTWPCSCSQFYSDWKESKLKQWKLLWSIQINHILLSSQLNITFWYFSLHYYGFVCFHVEYYRRQYWILLIDYLHWVLSFFLECAKQQLPLKGELMQTEDRYRKSVIWNTKQKEHKEYRMNFQDWRWDLYI